MALPHTIVELLDRANLTEGERTMYKGRIYAVFQKIRDKSYEEGRQAGISEGMDVCFDLMASEEDDKDVQTIP